MRAVECAVPDCAHVHAEDDDQLIEAVVRHAQEEHPGMEFGEEAAREFVRAGAYDDAAHPTG